MKKINKILMLSSLCGLLVCGAIVSNSSTLKNPVSAATTSYTMTVTGSTSSTASNKTVKSSKGNSFVFSVSKNSFYNKTAFNNISSVAIYYNTSSNTMYFYAYVGTSAGATTNKMSVQGYPDGSIYKKTFDANFFSYDSGKKYKYFRFGEDSEMGKSLVISKVVITYTC